MRVIKGNARQVTTTVFGPDAFALQAASLGIAVNPFGAMSVGRHTSGTPKGYSGDRGYGVNRWAGETIYPLQHFAGAAGPVASPAAGSYLVGFGAGVGGQPGLPSTGVQSGSPMPSWWGQQLGHYGMGG